LQTSPRYKFSKIRYIGVSSSNLIKNTLRLLLRTSRTANLCECPSYVARPSGIGKNAVNVGYPIQRLRETQTKRLQRAACGSEVFWQGRGSSYTNVVLDNGTSAKPLRRATDGVEKDEDEGWAS
jgi:hypothetical protein